MKFLTLVIALVTLTSCNERVNWELCTQRCTNQNQKVKHFEQGLGYAECECQ